MDLLRQEPATNLGTTILALECSKLYGIDAKNRDECFASMQSHIRKCIGDLDLWPPDYCVEQLARVRAIELWKDAIKSMLLGGRLSRGELDGRKSLA